MLKHWYLRALLNGLINALLLDLALDFSLSIYAENMALEWNFVICSTCAIIGVVAFMKLFSPMQGPRGKTAFLAFGTGIFLLAFLLLFCLPGFFPMRPTSNADGLLMIFLTLNFAVLAVLGRIIVIIISTMSNKSIKRSDT